MSCPVCGDKGIAIQEWTDAPHDYSVCLCLAGQRWRAHENNGCETISYWRLWCAQWQVDPGRVFMLEDIYTDSELAAAGISKPGTGVSREATLLKAGRQRK